MTSLGENRRCKINLYGNNWGAGLLPVVQGDVSEADRGYGRPLGAARSLPESRGRASGGVEGATPCKRGRSFQTSTEQISYKF